MIVTFAVGDPCDGLPSVGSIAPITPGMGGSCCAPCCAAPVTCARKFLIACRSRCIAACCSFIAAISRRNAAMSSDGLCGEESDTSATSETVASLVNIDCTLRLSAHPEDRDGWSQVLALGGRSLYLPHDLHPSD